MRPTETSKPRTVIGSGARFEPDPEVAPDSVEGVDWHPAPTRAKVRIGMRLRLPDVNPRRTLDGCRECAVARKKTP